MEGDWWLFLDALGASGDIGGSKVQVQVRLLIKLVCYSILIKLIYFIN